MAAMIRDDEAEAQRQAHRLMDRMAKGLAAALLVEEAATDWAGAMRARPWWHASSPRRSWRRRSRRGRARERASDSSAPSPDTKGSKSRTWTDGPAGTAAENAYPAVDATCYVLGLPVR